MCLSDWLGIFSCVNYSVEFIKDRTVTVLKEISDEESQFGFMANSI